MEVYYEKTLPEGTWSIFIPDKDVVFGKLESCLFYYWNKSNNARAMEVARKCYERLKENGLKLERVGSNNYPHYNVIFDVEPEEVSNLIKLIENLTSCEEKLNISAEKLLTNRFTITNKKYLRPKKK